MQAAKLCAFLSPLTNILIVMALFVKLHLLASLLKWCMYAATDSFSFCWIFIKWDMEVWILELHIFKHNKSLISSQDFPDVIASVIKVSDKPFDFTWGRLVLLSDVRSVTVSMSVNQSFCSVVSCPVNIGISCSIDVAKFVCFWAEHRVSVECFNMSSRGSSDTDGWSDMDSLCSSHSMWFKASKGCPSPAWTH